MKRKFVPVFFIFLLSLSFSSPLPSISDISDFIILPFALLSASLVALAYLFGVFLDSPNLKAWSIGEVSSLVFSVFLVFAVMGLMSFGDSLASTISPSAHSLSELPNDTLVSFRNSYSEAFKSTVAPTEYLVELSGISYSAAVPLYFLYTNTFSTPYSGVSSLSKLLNSASLESARGIWIMDSLILLLDFVPFVSNLILPLGLGLRFFSPTRKVGNIFISLGIGGSFFFPLSTYLFFSLSSPEHAIMNQLSGFRAPTMFRGMLKACSAVPDSFLDTKMLPIFAASNVITSLFSGAFSDSIFELAGYFKAFWRYGEFIMAFPVCTEIVHPVDLSTFTAWLICVATYSFTLSPLLNALYETVSSVAILSSVASLYTAASASSIENAFTYVFDFSKSLSSNTLSVYINLVLIGISTFSSTRGVLHLLRTEPAIIRFTSLV